MGQLCTGTKAGRGQKSGKKDHQAIDFDEANYSNRQQNQQA
jgi:hypothetical protein